MDQTIEKHVTSPGHLLQFYKKSAHLLESVAEFVHPGLGKGDGIIIVATRDHWQVLKSFLHEKDPAVEDYMAEGRLVFVDAHGALLRILDQGRPSKAAFMKFIDEVMHDLQHCPGVRIYGELVGLLCAGGRFTEAIELEQHWQEILLHVPDLSLMCAYQYEHFMGGMPSMAQESLPASQPGNAMADLDEETLYQRIAILEECSTALKSNNSEKICLENETMAVKEQLAQAGKLSILGELCAGLAHELNNPLAIILGSIRNSREMIARASEPVCPTLREVMKRLDYIDEASSRMTRIVRDVLMFGRQEEFPFDPLDIKGTLLKALDFMQNSFQLEDIQVQLLLPDDELDSYGDFEAVQQAFINILYNARDALASTAPEAVRMLMVSMQRLRDGRIEISFRDNGVGMDEQTLGKIFYPFFTTKAAGTGLGLAISHGIITRHKGRIFCESKPGQGTLVRVILPYLGHASAARWA